MSAMQEFVTKGKPAPAVTSPPPSANELDKMTPQLGDQAQHETFANWAESLIGLLILVFIIVSVFQFLMSAGSGV